MKETTATTQTYEVESPLELKIVTFSLFVLIIMAVLAASTVAYLAAKDPTILESTALFPHKWAVKFYINSEDKDLYHDLDYEFKEITDLDKLHVIRITGLNSKEETANVIQELNEVGLKNTMQHVYFNHETLQKIIDLYAENSLDVNIISAMVNTESGWDPEKVSIVGARGLMQLKPSTVLDILNETGEIELAEQEYQKILGSNEPELVKEERIHEEFLEPLGYDLYNPSVNVVFGVIYFDWLVTRFDGDAGLAIAGYNAGPNVVNGIVPNIQETQDYVPKVLSRAGYNLGSYTVQEGDTLYGIAEEQELDFSQFVVNNPSLIQIGQEIIILGY